MFPALSFTAILTVWLEAKLLDLLACQLSPPSKLYGSAASPLEESPAVTVRVASLFVQADGFPSTEEITGAALSIPTIVASLGVPQFPALDTARNL